MALRPCLRCRKARKLVGGYCVECGGREGGEPWRFLYTLRQWFLAKEAAFNRAEHRCEHPGCQISRRLQVHHTRKLRDLWKQTSSRGEFIAAACRVEWLRVLCPKHHASAEGRG